MALSSVCVLLAVIPSVISHASVDQRSASPCKITARKSVFQYNYYQKGELIIGGLISAHAKNYEYTRCDGVSILHTLCAFVSVEEYRSILAFIFAIEEINRDPDLLPNITLGYHIYDTCGDPKRTIDYTLQILSGKKEAPNYSCMDQDEVVGFIGDSGFQTSLAMAQLLSLYKYTQINYGTTDVILSDRQLYPTFYRIVPDDRSRYSAIIKCLKHFGWNWVGIITPNDGSGDMELQELSYMMSLHEICIEMIIHFTTDDKMNRRKIFEIKKLTAKVIVVCGHFSVQFIVFLYQFETISENITLIFHESWTNVKYSPDIIFPSVNCSLIFMLPSKNIPHITHIINNVNPSTRPADPILEDIWLRHFYCLTLNRYKNVFFQTVYNFSAGHCTRNIQIPSVFCGMKDSKSYYTYTAVYAMVHALHNMRQRENSPKALKLRKLVR